MTYDETVRIIVSPYLFFPMAFGVLDGAFSPERVSRDSVMKRLKRVVGGSVVSLYAGFFEELAFRWMVQPDVRDDSRGKVNRREVREEYDRQEKKNESREE